MSEWDLNDALTYSRRLYEETLNWYNNADKKAQVILTFAGAYLSFFTSLIFIKKEEFTNIFDNFGFETYLFLSLMMITISCSIYFALHCLWSRHNIEDKFSSVCKVSPFLNDRDEHINPEQMWFFHQIGSLCKDKFRKQLHVVSKKYEIDVLANEIHVLSKNVSKKHRCVNQGFLFLVLSLFMLLSMGVSYFIRLKFQ